MRGEASRTWIDIPPGIAGLAASDQAGWYVEGSYRFGEGLFGELPESALVGAVRVERVDFDLDRAGDDVRRWTAGLSFRPTPDTVFKLDAVLVRARDRFGIETPSSALLAGVASYF